MESWFDFDKRIFKHFSYLLMLQVVPLFVISSYLINEINPHLFTKQMVYYFIAAIVFLFLPLSHGDRSFGGLFPFFMWGI